MQYSINQIKKTAVSPYMSWSCLLFFDYLTRPVVWLIANFTTVTPNQITIAGFITRLLAVYPFYIGDNNSLLIAAGIYIICVIIDGVDGQIARLKNQKSTLGAYMDPMLDVIGDFLCFSAFAYGQFLITGEHFWILAGMAIIFLNMFVSVENHHLKIVRMSLEIPQESGANNFRERKRKAFSQGIFYKIMAKMKQLQKQFGKNLFSIDVFDIRVVILCIAPLSGYLKEFVQFGIALFIVKLSMDKVIQIISKEPVFNN